MRHMMEHTNPLSVDDYRARIALDEPFVTTSVASPSEYASFLQQALAHLEKEEVAKQSNVALPDAPRARLGALLTLRPPAPLSSEVHTAIDALLQTERGARPHVDISTLPRFALPGGTGSTECALWQGDITTLASDAIVNAANSRLLGCFRPNHACIDHVIHAAAGPRLREDCARIMQLQGTLEPTGTAKATRAYNLPSKFVLHTVGPIVNGPLSQDHVDDLARAYRACLDTAVQIGGVRSVAFCGISTGLFGFPRDAAARIALRTIAEWIGMHPGALDLVVFNVFADADKASYVNALRGNS